MRVQGSKHLHEPGEAGLVFQNFTVAKTYLVCAIEYDNYRLVNDLGEPILAPIDRFEVIDPRTPKSFFTHDHGSGPGTFLVPGFFERWHDGDLRFQRLFDLEYQRLVAEDAALNGPLPESPRV